MTKQEVRKIIDSLYDAKVGDDDPYATGWVDALDKIDDAVNNFHEEDDAEALKKIIVAMCKDRYGAKANNDDQ